MPPRHRLQLGVLAALVGLGTALLPIGAVAGASTVSTVTVTSAAPTSLVANTASTWTIGFTTSATGVLAAGSTITVTLPLGFTTSSSSVAAAPVTPSSFASGCVTTGADAKRQNMVVITLANSSGSCSLAASSAATLTIGVVNGLAGNYGGANFAVATSADTTGVAPSSGATITPTAVTAVSVTSTAPTSLVAAASSTWTWGFTTSATGGLGAGATITITFPAGFAAIATGPAATLKTPSTFPTSCVATASSQSQSNVIVLTLANNGANTCALAASTSAALTITVVNGTSDDLTTMFIATSMDASPMSPTGTAPVLTAATAITGATFTTTAPTSLVANTNATWSTGFTTSAGGSLAAGGFVAVQLPSGFTTAATAPTVALLTPSSFATSCTATGSDLKKTNLIVVTLANKGANTCTLAATTVATLTIAVVNGPTATYGPASFTIWTSADGTAVAPVTGTETIVSAGPPGTATHWTPATTSSSGEAHAGAAPGAPASPKGGAASSYLCDSTTSEVVDLTWSAVTHATAYVVLQASTAGGTYSAASPTPVFIGTTATITYTTAVTEYFKVEALVGAVWVSALSGNAVNGSVASGYVVTSTTAPECTNN